MRLPLGVSDFSEIIIDKYQFVDKTKFIKEVIDDGSKAILITRPRRFGKTLNLSMLHHFLRVDAQAKNLFDGLDIAKDIEFCKTHQSQYPVIFISFKDVKKASFDEAFKNIKELMKDLYGHHRYLLEGDILYDNEKRSYNLILNQEADTIGIGNAIRQLSKYLKTKFGKNPFILIDEYDTPIQEAYLKGYYDEMVILMRSILGEALKDNSYMAKAVLTGITRVSQESLFSGLNNIRVYSMLREQYGQYFGFTEIEVIKLMNDTRQQLPLETIKEWYNGYQVGKYTLYNPWSIINCLADRGELRPYWLNTANNDIIKNLLTKAKAVIKQSFEDLLQGNVIEQPLSESLIFMEVDTREEALWSLLFYAGYLKVLSYELRGNKFIAKLAIPNKEVSFVYDNIVEQWFSDTVSLDSYAKFTQSLISGDIAKFKLYLSTYIMQSGSYFDFTSNTPEQIFHIFILGLVVGLRDKYIIHSNQEAGLGRFDVMFIPKDKKMDGIIFEFKTSNSPKTLLDKSMEALAQVKNNKYTEEFKQHGVKSVLAMGMAFHGKQMDLVHEIIDIS